MALEEQLHQRKEPKNKTLATNRTWLMKNSRISLFKTSSLQELWTVERLLVGYTLAFKLARQ
jgi:hypothetical protein